MGSRCTKSIVEETNQEGQFFMSSSVVSVKCPKFWFFKINSLSFWLLPQLTIWLFQLELWVLEACLIKKETSSRQLYLMYNKNWIEKTVYLLKLAIKSPSLSTPIPSAFTPYPLFQWYPQSNKILSNLTIIILVVQVGAVKIYGGALETLRKKEKLFCRFLKIFTLCMTKLRVLVLCFSYFTDNSIIYGLILPKEHYKPKPCKLDKCTSCWKSLKMCVHALGASLMIVFPLLWRVKQPWIDESKTHGKWSLPTPYTRTVIQKCVHAKNSQSVALKV